MMVNPAPERQSMEALEAELGDFSYIVSHDLATVCRHLTQFSQLLLKEVGEELTESQQSLAGHIETAGGRCQAMMEQLLAFSRLQQRPLNVARRDAKALVDAAVLQLGGEIRAADAEIAVSSTGEVTGDGELLTVALRHLIQNAVKFRRPDKRSRVVVDSRIENDCWVVRVIDNGIGLDSAQHEKAFRMFWQLSQPRGLPGIGAGLAICRRIARRHGGDVNFVSHDKGTCVEFVIPNVRLPQPDETEGA